MYYFQSHTGNKKVQFIYKTLPAIHLAFDSKKASNS
jgi:hypothetical protein